MVASGELDDRPVEDVTVASMLRARAEKIPDDDALVYGPDDRHVTYGELDEVANRVANGLRERGVEPGDEVSVMASNPLNVLFAMFGANKAGAVYAPINHEYEGETLSYQLNDTNPSVLVVEDRYLERVDAVTDDLDSVPEIVVADTGTDADSRLETTSFAALREASADDPHVSTSWNDPASIVYTSGTTGLPKGVVIPNRWIFANYTAAKRALLDRDDVVHTSLPLYHIGGVYADVVAGLIAGGTVALWDRFSPTEFWDRVEEYDATSATLISVMMPWLTNPERGADDHENTLNKVHMQPLPEDYEEVAERFGFDVVTVAFAQTETGAPVVGVIEATGEDAGTPESIRRGRSPDEVFAASREMGLPVVDSVEEERYMGRPREDIVEVAVLDDRDERAATGAVGELAVRPKRPGLILQEYHAKPEKTVEATRNLWFHTGDAAYRDESGDFYFVDRLGDTIRRRGENISSMQIQDAVVGMDAVSSAAAFPVPAPEGGEDRVGLAVEPADGADLGEDDVREYLDGRLPEFMRPDRLWLVESIPTTETNKMEKYKLRSELLEDGE